VAGTGLDVWEIIATWKESVESFQTLRQNYPWLSEAQLRSALGYYEIYPSEINARLKHEERWTLKRIRRELPFSQPRND